MVDGSIYNPSQKSLGHQQKMGGCANLRGLIDHLHYDVIGARPDGSCSRPSETGPSVSGKPVRKPAGQKCYRDEHDKNNVAHGGRCPWRSSINIFNRLILILAEQPQHFMLQNLSLCLEKFGNGLNRRMNVLAGQTRSGNDSRKFTFYSRFLQRSPVNDGIAQAVVVLSALGFHAQAKA